MRCCRHRLVGLLVTLCVASCGEEDRVFTVHCLPPNGRISVDLGVTDLNPSKIGELNSEHFSLGTILRLTPITESIEPGTSRDVHVLEVAAHDLTAPRPVRDATLSTDISVEIDDDVERVAARQGIDLERRILSGAIRLYVFHGTLKALSGVAPLINEEPTAVSFVRAGRQGTRTVVISAAVYGAGPRLFANLAPLNSVAANAVKLGNFYLHANYACSGIDDFLSESSSTRETDPILVFYTPIAYDASTGRVTADARPLDLTKFRL